MKFKHPFRLIISLSFLLCCQFTYGQNAISERINENLNQITLTEQRTPLQEVDESVLQIPIASNTLSQRQILQINSTQVQNIINNAAEYLRMSVPIQGQDVELQMFKANIFTNEFRAELSSKPNQDLEIDQGIHYWGIVADNPNSLVTISFIGDEIAGGIHYNGKQMSLAKLRNNDYHVLFENEDFNHTLDFNCQALPIDGSQLPEINGLVEGSALLDCVGIHVEVDHSFYLDRGSSTANVTNYVNALFGQVAALYANESIQVAISFLRIWDMPDPYNQGSELDDLTNQGYGTTNGNLVHLLHSDGSGGVAYVDGLCNSTFNTGVSNIFGTFNNVPTYSWDVEVVTHELGHNLGSPHTHACAWNGNNTAIDGCGPASGNGEGCNGPIPAFGTIMSYCHLVSGSGIDFNLGFGQQPGDLIRANVASKNCQNFCAIVCPSQVTTSYNQTEDLCASLGTYTLPTSYTGLVLDNATAATYEWSSGNYISAGGTPISGTTYTLTNPPNCAPTTERIYLNVGCSTGGANDIDAGILTLNIYPDPTQFALADLVTFTDGACDAPTWTVTSGCESYVTVAQNGGPTFPVAAGASGTVNYDVTLNYPVECCSVPGGDIILTGTIGATTLNTSNDSQACQSGTQPSIWEIPFTIPTAQNATTVNTTGLGSIIEVCLNITLNNTDAVILSLDSPDCGAYEWEDLWVGSAFNGGSNTGSTTVCFTPGTSNGAFDGTFDGDGNTNGNGSFSTCGINSNQWVLYIADYNCYLGGATGGSLNSATISFNDGTQPGQPGLCEFTATANYNCAGCIDCNDAACTTTQACDDNDPCTENDMETVITSDGSVCVPCAGTAIASCSGTTTVQACDDGNPCTENDMETIDDCDGSICVPCAGTAIASCSGTATVQACDDGDPCTENDMETIDDCDGSICVPCAGTAIVSCSGSTTIQACDDGNPCTTNDMETIDDCDGSICVPCAGTAIASCSGTTTIQACNDGDPCTENDMETVDDCDGSVCVPCAGTAIASCSGTTTVQACDDGNPCTENDMETIDDCDGSVCVPCAGTAIASCSGTTTVQACDDGDPCTENDMETIDDCDGSICVPCAGTAIASCSGTTTVQACDDGDPCTENDIETVDACDGSICVPCAGTPTSCSQTVMQACDDNNSCTINDMEGIDACTGAVCIPCAGTFNQASCCGDVNLDINFDANPTQSSWDITDDNGNVVASGGPYGNQFVSSNLNLSPAACLPDGCYTLTFYDSAGDGMCPRRTATVLTGINIATIGIGGVFNGIPRGGRLTCGDYTLSDNNGTVLASGGGRFGSSETNSFCISGGLAEFNYQPDHTYGKQSTSNNDVNMWVTPTLTKDEITIRTTFNETEYAQINIVDINGRIMQQHSQDGNSTRELQLDVSDFPAGIYFVQMMSNDTVLVEKFIKK